MLSNTWNGFGVSGPSYTPHPDTWVRVTRSQTRGSGTTVWWRGDSRIRDLSRRRRGLRWVVCAQFVDTLRCDTSPVLCWSLWWGWNPNSPTHPFTFPRRVRGKDLRKDVTKTLKLEICFQWSRLHSKMIHVNKRGWRRDVSYATGSRSREDSYQNQGYDLSCQMFTHLSPTHSFLWVFGLLHGWVDGWVGG